MNKDEFRIKSRLKLTEYYKKFINGQADLKKEKWQCCPFHKEKTPSFKYDEDKDECICYGACHTGFLDVIGLHRKNMQLKTRQESIDSLLAILKLEKTEIDLTPLPEDFDERDAELKYLTSKASKLAKTTEDIIRFDYILTKHQRCEERINDLLEFIYSFD